MTTARNISVAIVKAVEAGINAHLNKSIIYSPFRIFFNLFKKGNPQLVRQVRSSVKEDIDKILDTIENFNPNIFIAGTRFKPKGVHLLQICYNIGIQLMKKKLNVITAFKAVKDYKIRNQIYNQLLQDIKEATVYIIAEQIENR